MHSESEDIFRAVECQKQVVRGKRMCDLCSSVASKISSAVSRLQNANPNNWEFTPTNKVVGLLAKDGFIEKLRGKNRLLARTVHDLEIKAAEDLEDSGEIDEKSTMELVTKLKEALTTGKLKEESFTYLIIKQQLECLLKVRFFEQKKKKEKERKLTKKKDDIRGFRWDRRILHWALTLQFHGGKATIEHLRGKATKGEGQHGTLENKRDQWALYLPGDSTLRGYLPLIRPYAPINEERVREIAAACANLTIQKGGLAFDEIEIRAGLVFNRSTQELIGKSDEAIKVKDAAHVSATSIQDSLATHVFQVIFR